MVTAAKLAWAAAVKAVNVAMGALGGPIGWITLLAGALVGGVIAVVNWFNRATEEGEKLAVELENVTESTQRMNDSVAQSERAFESQLASIESNRVANEGLIGMLDELSEKEVKSAADKEIIKGTVDQLNESIEGLNLSYNEEANALSMSSEELGIRNDLLAATETHTANQERLTEVLREQNEVEAQLDHINNLREVYNQRQEEGAISKREHGKATEELEEKEQSLMVTSDALAIAQGDLADSLVKGAERVAQKTSEANENMILSYDRLSSVQSTVVDDLNSKWDEYADATTNMFDKISTESKISVDDMIENLRHNQAAVESWSENIAFLSDEGINQGLINDLITAGPESAALVQEIVDSGDLMYDLSDTFGEGAELATDILATTLGEGGDQVVAEIGHLIGSADVAMMENIQGANFQEHGLLVPENLAEGVEHGSPRVDEAANKMTIGVKDRVDEAFNSGEFKAVGEAIPDGIVEGIENKSGNVESSTEDMSDKAIIGARRVLEINSPSRVFRSMGDSIIEGLVLGIDNGSGRVNQSILNMLNTAVRSSQQSFNQMTNAYRSGVATIQTELNKLVPITLGVMNRNTSTLQTGAQRQVNIMKQLAAQKVQALSRTPQQLQQITQQSMRLMQTELQNGTRLQIDTIRNFMQQQMQTVRPMPQQMRQIVQMTMTNMNSVYQNGARQQVSLMNRLARDKVNAFRSIPSQLNAVGRNAMSGLNAGLIAGRSRVLSTARGIANDVSRTMKNALKIHSPSRVMRDDVGRWIPEGIAEGIGRNANVVHQEIRGLTDDMSRIANQKWH